MQSNFSVKKIEEVTEKVNNEKSDVRELLDSQAMIDALIVKTSNDILAIKPIRLIWVDGLKVENY